MKKTTILLGFLLALFSVGAFAQPGPPLNPEDDPTSDGYGSSCKHCFFNSDNGGQDVSCVAVHSICNWNCEHVSGFAQCIAHNAPVGPPYCEVWGASCSGWVDADYAAYHATPKKTGSEIENQTAGIEMFLRQSSVISDADLNDFIANTDYSLRGEPYAIAAQKRLDAFRAEFNRLVARGDPRRELKPGAIPVAPHKPTKAPAATLAAR